MASSPTLSGVVSIFYSNVYVSYVFCCLCVYLSSLQSFKLQRRKVNPPKYEQLLLFWQWKHRFCWQFSCTLTQTYQRISEWAFLNCQRWKTWAKILWTMFESDNLEFAGKKYGQHDLIRTYIVGSQRTQISFLKCV